MKTTHKLLFEVVNKEIDPAEPRHELSYRNMIIMNALDLEEHVNFSVLMIKHMEEIITPKLRAHKLAYGLMYPRCLHILGCQ